MAKDDIIDYQEEQEPDGHIPAMLIYLLSFFAPILAPLLIWLLVRKESSFVDFHGKQYFNFLISYAIYTFVAGILTVVIIGIILLLVLGLAIFIFTIVGAVKSYNKEEYVIPFSIQFFK